MVRPTVRCPITRGSRRRARAIFVEGAIIRNTPAGKIDLGASWAPFAAAEYYIPAGAEVTGNIGLNGTFSPNPSPILYVAGKLTLDASRYDRPGDARSASGRRGVHP